MSVPFATWAFGGVSVLLLFRGLWNPHRAVTHSGAVLRCPGPAAGGCSDMIALSAEPGTRVYACGSGTVVAAGDQWLHIQVSNEPVVLHYQGVVPSVAVGQNVGRGRGIGEALGGVPVEFGVTALVNDNGTPRMVSVEPRSWLAVRGFKLTVKKTPESNLWCGPGRHVTVPADVHSGCGLQMPDRANFAFLPISVTEQ